MFSPDALAIMELSSQRDIDIAAKMCTPCHSLDWIAIPPRFTDEGVLEAVRRI